MPKIGLPATMSAVANCAIGRPTMRYSRGVFSLISESLGGTTAAHCGASWA